MKKLALFAASVAVLFSSCAQETLQEGETAQGKIILEVSAVDDMNTRAGLYSEEAVHEVENVTVYAFVESGADFVYAKGVTFPTWAKGSNFQRYEIPNANELPVGNYKFLAVGRDAVDNFQLPAMVVGTTKFQDIVASVANAGAETEIFSGSTTKNITDQGARIAITITRQVAGFLGYFKNVPTEINGTTVTYLRLSINQSNTALNLSDGTVSNLQVASRNLIDINLSTQAISGDVYAGNTVPNTVVQLANTQLAGAFLIPVTQATLTLGLYDAAGNPLKVWNIKNGTSSQFDIAPNNFYALGTKQASGTTTGGGPTPTPDNPIDLMVSQEITVTIIPDWGVINDLTIEEQPI